MALKYAAKAKKKFLNFSRINLLSLTFAAKSKTNHFTLLTGKIVGFKICSKILS